MKFDVFWQIDIDLQIVHQQGAFLQLCSSLQFLSTAQVPDDEQFVPDFQSENCEYLKIYYLFSLTMYLEVVQTDLVIIHICLKSKTCISWETKDSLSKDDVRCWWNLVDLISYRLDWLKSQVS